MSVNFPSIWSTGLIEHPEQVYKDSEVSKHQTINFRLLTALGAFSAVSAGIARKLYTQRKVTPFVISAGFAAVAIVTAGIFLTNLYQIGKLTLNIRNDAQKLSTNHFCQKYRANHLSSALFEYLQNKHWEIEQGKSQDFLDYFVYEELDLQDKLLQPVCDAREQFTACNEAASQAAKLPPMAYDQLPNKSFGERSRVIREWTAAIKIAHCASETSSHDIFELLADVTKEEFTKAPAEQQKAIWDRFMKHPDRNTNDSFRCRNLLSLNPLPHYYT